MLLQHPDKDLDKIGRFGSAVLEENFFTVRINGAPSVISLSLVDSATVRGGGRTINLKVDK